MNVKTRPTLTGMLAIAAAGIFAAGTVGDRANVLFGGTDVDAASTPARYAEASPVIDCAAAVPGTGEDCPELSD